MYRYRKYRDNTIECLMRIPVVLCFVILLLFTGSCKNSTEKPMDSEGLRKTKVPVILDTDIGDDIDDTWALAFLLKCPELDVKMVLSATGDTTFRAKVIAKVLEQCGRTDIPIGIGKPTPDQLERPLGKYTRHPYYQRSWVEGYDLSDYKGTTYEDGVGTMIDLIMKSEEPITVIAVGPLPNLAEALERQPRIANKSKVVGMHGSVRQGYNHSPQPAAEWNVVTYVKDAQKVFHSQWPMKITPLDTCGLIKLQGEKYYTIFCSDKPVAKTVIDAYRHWLERPGDPPEQRWDFRENSSVLYDTAAVYLAISDDGFEMETLGISVNDQGYTVIDENAKQIDCALEWKDLGAFEDFLVSRLTNGQ